MEIPANVLSRTRNQPNFEEQLAFRVTYTYIYHKLTNEMNKRFFQPQEAGFVMEEEMLSSHGKSVPAVNTTALGTRNFSGEETSKLFKTNEVSALLFADSDRGPLIHYETSKNDVFLYDRDKETSKL